MIDQYEVVYQATNQPTNDFHSKVLDVKLSMSPQEWIVSGEPPYELKEADPARRAHRCWHAAAGL